MIVLTHLNTQVTKNMPEFKGPKTWTQSYETHEDKEISGFLHNPRSGSHRSSVWHVSHSSPNWYKCTMTSVSSTDTVCHARTNADLLSCENLQCEDYMKHNILKTDFNNKLHPD